MVAALALSACTGPVRVAGPEGASGADAATCRRLVAALPDSVSDQPRREVEPAGAAAAAWGDPPVVLRCGLRRPPGLDRTASCQEVDGVGWWIPDRQVEAGVQEITMTTVDRSVYVQVSIPRDHFPPATTMVDLADAVSSTVPQTDPCV